MPRVTIIIGLPGSGKSKYLEPIRQRGVPVFDDFHANAIGNSHAFANSRNREPLKTALASGKDCVIADVEYCRDSQLNEAITGVNRIAAEIGNTVPIELVFFANDPSACKANVSGRGRDGAANELAKIEELTRVYRIPLGTQTLSVWTPPTDGERRFHT